MKQVTGETCVYYFKIPLTKAKEVRWIGHVASMAEIRMYKNIYIYLKETCLLKYGLVNSIGTDIQ
jgi:hypothetical protein